MSIVIRLAAKKDIAEIVKLLKKGKLNAEGVEQHVDHFIVVEKEETSELIGTAGLEVFPDGCGLLRSLVVAETAPSRLGMDLIRILLQLADKQELREIYLLTRTSQSVFELVGFEQASWSSLPEQVRGSAHVQRVDPNISTVMVYKENLAPSGDNDHF
jgi:amino-acid N-acetyltransferase